MASAQRPATDYNRRVEARRNQDVRHGNANGNSGRSSCCFTIFGSTVDRGELCAMSSCVLIVVAIVLLVVLLPLSIRSVGPADMSVVGTRVSRRLLPDVRFEGRHVVPPDSYFITVPRIFISETTTIRCLSSDGLAVLFTPSTQHQYGGGDIRQSILNLGGADDIHDYIRLLIRSTVLDVCGNFTGQEFFTKRQDVETRFSESVNLRLRSDPLVGVVGGAQQLRNFQLPDELLAAINDAQLSFEDVAVAFEQRPEQLIIANTAAIKATEVNRATIFSATAEAESILFAGVTAARSRTAVWDQVEILMLTEIANIGLTSEEYIDFLLESASLTSLSPERRACLTRCTANCWYCWVSSATPAVNV